MHPQQHHRIVVPSPTNKTSSSSICPNVLSSPRLTSPRGSLSPRNNSSQVESVVLSLLRHTRGVIVVVGIALVFFWRPTTTYNIDSGINLSTFLDPSSIDHALSQRASSGSSQDSSGPMSNVDSSGAWSPLEHSENPMASTHFILEDSNVVMKGEKENDESGLVSVELDEQQPSRTVSPNKTISASHPRMEQPETTRKSHNNENSKISSSKESMFSEYDASKHPLLSIDSKPESIDAHFVVDVSGGGVITAQSKFILDGLERSAYTRVVGLTFLNPRLQQVRIQERNDDADRVWIVDWGSMHRDCHRLARVLEKLERPLSERVLLIDYSGSARQTTCEFWDGNIRLAKRTIVENRHYDHQRREIVSGRLADNTVTPGGHPVIHAPLIVRETFVTAVRNSTHSQNPLKAFRDTDLCFFWKRGDYSHYGFWRRDVSNFIKRLGKLSNYTTMVEVMANDVDGMEQGNIQLKYIKALVKCKIVVVAQRDEWEDHFRLYESLSSGALVMSDRMMAPPVGLKNKTNVLVYESLEKLESLVHYYLGNYKRRHSIARRGMELALGRYRSWHRIEELIFGRPLTNVDQPYVEGPERMARPKISVMDSTAFIQT